jgi:hypothetical protein
MKTQRKQTRERIDKGAKKFFRGRITEIGERNSDLHEIPIFNQKAGKTMEK